MFKESRTCKVSFRVKVVFNTDKGFRFAIAIATGECGESAVPLSSHTHTADFQMSKRGNTNA
jgi:hypothetical protein